MYIHQVLELFKTFTKKEFMWFLKFLNSPYFNNRKKITKLFLILKRFHPNYEAKNFTKIHIHKLLYGNSTFNDSTLRNLMSDLLKLAQQFLKHEVIDEREIESSFYLTKELFKRGQLALFKNQTVNTKLQLEKNNERDGSYFYHMGKIEIDSFYANLLNQKVLKKSIVETESQKLINGIVFSLSYFILDSMKHNDNLLKYSRTYNLKNNIDTVSEFAEIFNFDKLISYVKNNSAQTVPIIEVYNNLLKTFINFEEDSYYFEFKKSLIQNAKHLGLSENNYLHARLIDYWVLKKNAGSDTNVNIDKELFSLFDIYIKNEYYKTDSNDYLPFDIYRNVLINCITMKKLTFMQNFISKYSKKLIPQHITSVENYSYALLYFEKCMFSKALSYLNKIKFDQFVFKLDMKNLQLKISYELEQFESAISIIDTYKHFLKNNTLMSESRRVLHNNFVNTTNNLIQYRTGSKKINLDFLLHKVKNSKNTFSKEWLLEKLTQQTDKYKKSRVA
ncbi:MAG: hypothetical protein ABIY50_09845 [Ignavibacteria bacterium]